MKPRKAQSADAACCSDHTVSVPSPTAPAPPAAPYRQGVSRVRESLLTQLSYHFLSLPLSRRTMNCRSDTQSLTLSPHHHCQSTFPSLLRLP